MRIGAGILMVAFGLFLLITVISKLNRYDFDVYDVAFSLFLIIPGAFIITAGVFCLERKYWKVCFASALGTFLIMIMWLTGYAADSIWSAWVVSMVGTFPIIFVLLTKKEWQVIQG